MDHPFQYLVLENELRYQVPTGICLQSSAISVGYISESLSFYSRLGFISNENVNTEQKQNKTRQIEMRYAQLVMGPAGSGKSTYCSTLANHAKVSGRRVDVVNLDPAADTFSYEPLCDVRDLIQVEDAMEDDELKLGPNGSLIFCWEFLLKNLEWLQKGGQAMLFLYILLDINNKGFRNQWGRRQR